MISKVTKEWHWHFFSICKTLNRRFLVKCGSNRNFCVGLIMFSFTYACYVCFRIVQHANEVRIWIEWLSEPNSSVFGCCLDICFLYQDKICCWCWFCVFNLIQFHRWGCFDVSIVKYATISSIMCLFIRHFR